MQKSPNAREDHELSTRNHVIASLGTGAQLPFAVDLRVPFEAGAR